MNRSEENLLVIDGENYTFFPSVGLKLTGSCRFDCPFCCEPQRTQEIAPLSNFLQITDLLYKYGTRRLCLTGGEPLHYPEIEHLLRHTKSLGFYNLLLTSDGKMLSKKYSVLSPSLDAVRISVHGVGKEHDKTVGVKGAFEEIDNAIVSISNPNAEFFITTVVTSLSIDSLVSIAKWCQDRNIKKLFLFGLMKSGRGDSFINKHGAVPKEAVHDVMNQIHKEVPKEVLEIIYYEYVNNAECILVYGDGKIIIDPCQDAINYQCDIGNILHESSSNIMKRFFEDQKNYDGYCEHFRMYNKIDSHNQ